MTRDEVFKKYEGVELLKGVRAGSILRFEKDSYRYQSFWNKVPDNIIVFESMFSKKGSCQEPKYSISWLEKNAKFLTTIAVGSTKLVEKPEGEKYVWDKPLIDIFGNEINSGDLFITNYIDFNQPSSQIIQQYLGGRYNRDGNLVYRQKGIRPIDKDMVVNKHKKVIKIDIDSNILDLIKLTNFDDDITKKLKLKVSVEFDG